MLSCVRWNGSARGIDKRVLVLLSDWLATHGARDTVVQNTSLATAQLLHNQYLKPHLEIH